MSRKKKKQQIDPATEQYTLGKAVISEVGMFRPMMSRATVYRHENNLCPKNGWAIVTSNGNIHVHPTRRAKLAEWQYILAHCLLHLAFGHFKKLPDEESAQLWNQACNAYIARFLAQLKYGKAPEPLENDLSKLPTQSEEVIFRMLSENNAPASWRNCNIAGGYNNSLIWEPKPRYQWQVPPNWAALFGRGITLAVTNAVAATSNTKLTDDGHVADLSTAEQARRWFVSSYPLLGALAAGFKIIEDQRICQQMQISVAAVNAELQEIYINPASGLLPSEMRFVMAHEMLHVGLRHDARIQWRDPYLWNIACDYVINEWLLTMRIGVMPTLGALHDPELAGLSAEAIYDRIVNDLRKYRKLWTLRGKGLGDLLPSRAGWWQNGDGVTLDQFYRNCLAQGLEYHRSQGRGLLPSNLIEEINALSQPPIPWDVKLASWFDLHFPPLEKRRSYARPSRRQSSTPNIPRPNWIIRDEEKMQRTFGVVLDTSGSMGRNLLAKALGAIASYAMARDVPLVRVVFCDATTYDQGYMPPESIAGRVRVRGRGGTVLQPAINLLEREPDFPKDGPILIITDGECDRLVVRNPRPHAYLLPKGQRLPFPAKGELFYFD
ncbi:MAG: DUF2201 family putative metallopeptidase [Candidatus Promineifilaceae bacterium]